MFTGIITDLGRVGGVERAGMTRLTIDTGYDLDTIALGASIACNGACLSVTAKKPGAFVVEVSVETLSKTTLANWRVGTLVNLERALRLGEELGGHLVSGHVDGVAVIVDRRQGGDSLRFLLEAPESLRRYIAPKGSVTLDGVSLTVNGVEGPTFDVNVIPLTQRLTNFGHLNVGDRVNLEIDLLARYVARLLERSAA